MLRANVCDDGGNTGTVIVSPKALVHSWDKEHHHQLCAAVIKFGHISSRDASSNLDLTFACSALKGIAKSVEVFCHSVVLSEHLLLPSSGQTCVTAHRSGGIRDRASALVLVDPLQYFISKSNPVMQVPIGIIFLPFSVQIATEVAGGLYEEQNGK